MKKSLGILGISALAGALAFGGMAMARGPGGPGGPGGAHMKQLLEKLDLDDAQTEQAQELRQASMEAHQEMEAGREQAMDSLMDELASDEPNRKAVHSTIDEGVEAMADMLHDRADAMLDLVETFTPEQRDTLVTELESMRELRGERRDAQRRRGGPGLE